ncbi:MAG: xanthine dehydrogenase family protein subunit [Rhizobiaceae bacterium]|nr:xanthine dehydrogenase family protein subunit [Rhizobiaceae bacterium]
MIRYVKPKKLETALALMGEASWRVLAGGTDFYPALGRSESAGDVLDINGLGELSGISETPSHFVIGARTTWAELMRTELPAAFDALKAAAREIGSVQIQNMASLGGNLCNASPAADGVPALLILDAQVELRSARAVRRLDLGDFILGNRRTALQPNELLTAIRIPKQAANGRSRFVKLGARRYLVISIAMAAARVGVGPDGRVVQAAVAVGACSAAAMRLSSLEASLIGRRPGPALDEVIAAADFSGLSPIDDVRGTAEYRRDAAREIVGRAVIAAAASGLAGAMATAAA